MTVLVSIVLVVLVFAGCGATRSSPDAPMGAGGLTPTIEDKEAGLVGIAPNFDIKAYRVIGVALFPVTDKLEDEGDRKFAATMAAFFNTELVRRLRESGQFQRVVNLTEGGYKPVAGEKMLRLEGDITRLGRGSRVARYFAGIYGAGRQASRGTGGICGMRTGIVAGRAAGAAGFWSAGTDWVGAAPGCAAVGRSETCPTGGGMGSSGGAEGGSFSSGWRSKMGSFGKFRRRALRRSNSSSARRYWRSAWD